MDELVATDVVRVAGKLDLSAADRLGNALSKPSSTPGGDLVLDVVPSIGVA